MGTVPAKRGPLAPMSQPDSEVFILHRFESSLPPCKRNQSGSGSDQNAHVNGAKDLTG